MTSRIVQFCHKLRLLWLQQHLPIISGILVATSYIPSYPVAVFWSFVPLWLHWLKNPEPRQVFISGWISQFFLTLVGFHWVAHTAHEFGHLPWPVSVLVLLGFCCFANLHIALSGLVWSFINKRLHLNILQSATVLANLTLLGEVYFPKIFPWHHGYVWLWAGWEGYQFADIIGLQGLSAICIFANALVLWIWLTKKNIRTRITAFAAILALLISFNILGSQYGKKWKVFDSEIKILAVQANIGNLMKYFAEQGSFKATQTIAEKYFALTRKGLSEYGPADFIVWPETAYPEYLSPDFRKTLYHVRLGSFISELGIPLITGGYRHDLGNRKTYNSIFFVEKDGTILDPPYSKSILLAFGEYFPGAQYLPFLKEIVPTISDFARGPGPKVQHFNDLTFGPQICYESLYPDFSRTLVQDGADIFLNVTNDSWFGSLFEPFQHLYMTLGRAIEFRRPLIRSTNTGVTTAILADGTILEQSPLHKEWTHIFSLKYRKNAEQTVFSRFGMLLDYFFVVLLVLTLLWVKCNRRGRHSNR